MIESKEGAINALRGIGENLIELSDFLAKDTPEAKPRKPKEKKEEPASTTAAFSLADVRKALAEKSTAGYTAEVRALLEKHGSTKLSTIDPAEYSSMMEELEKIGEGA